MSGYTNIDGAKVSKSLPVKPTDWVPTQTVANYSIHCLDKTVEVPSLCEKYSGAGKVEIWKAYTDAIPTEDLDEFDHAIKNYSTAKTYDAKGNELKGATTGISIAETSSVPSAIIRTEYYDLAGSRLSSPQRGVNIVKSIHANGQSTTKKVVF